MSTSEGSLSEFHAMPWTSDVAERALPLPVFEVNYFATQDWADRE